MSTRSFEHQAGWKRAGRAPFRVLLLVGAMLMLNGCATLPDHEPIQVTVAGTEPLPGEGLEVRMLVKLRVQNPNDAPIDYDGVSLKLEVQGKTYASGVSDAHGSVPRFGESVIEVPMTISTLRVALQAIGGIRNGKAPEKIKYKLKGKLSGTTWGSESFAAEGELDLSTVSSTVPE